MLNFLKKVLNNSLKGFIWLWKKLAMFIGSSILLILGIVLLFVFTYSDQSENAVNSGYSKKFIQHGNIDEIAVVRLGGEITSTADESVWGMASYSINPRSVGQLLNQLSQLAEIKAVLLVINSPGGSVAASEEIYQQIKLLNENKPVFVYFEEMAASGGYYIALPARKIMASIPTITGSIGVIAYDTDVSGLMEKAGIKMSTYQSGPLKDFGSPTRPSTIKEREIFQSIVDDSYQLFLDRILEHRQIEELDLLTIADGRIYSGKQALENGLIDELGTMSSALSMVIEETDLENPSVCEYSLSSNWFSGLLESSVGKLLPLSIINQGLLTSKSGLYFY